MMPPHNSCGHVDVYKITSQRRQILDAGCRNLHPFNVISNELGLLRTALPSSFQKLINPIPPSEKCTCCHQRAEPAVLPSDKLIPRFQPSQEIRLQRSDGTEIIPSKIPSPTIQWVQTSIMILFPSRCFFEYARAVDTKFSLALIANFEFERLFSCKVSPSQRAF